MRPCPSDSAVGPEPQWTTGVLARKLCPAVLIFKVDLPMRLYYIAQFRPESSVRTF